MNAAKTTKAERVIALLSGTDGATLKAIMPYASHCTSLG